MSFLIKLIPALGVTAVGGGVFAGVTKSSNSSSTTNETSLTTGLEREGTLQAPQSHQQAPAQLQNPQPQEPNSVVSLPQEESRGEEVSSQVTQAEAIRTEVTNPQETQTGNCVVIDVSEKVKEQLPKGLVYVGFFCKNSNQNNSSLEDWKGYFPSDLLTKTPDSFKDGARVNIDVTDKEDTGGQQQLQEDLSDSEEEPIWTVFKSDQFKTNTITGNYGSSTIKDDIEEEEESEESEEKEIYKVKVSEPTDSKEFYLQWL